MSIDTRTIISNAVSSIAFEGLEGRQMMSASGVRFHDNTLVIKGTSNNDQINVAWTKAGRSVRVNLNGNLSKSFDGRKVFTVQVDAGNGNNRITMDSDLRSSTVITTGNGRDTITSGMSNDAITSGGGNDVIDTGAGNDIIYAGNGNDSINAGSGNDLIVAEAGNDTANTGTGTDQVYGGTGTNTITAEAGDFVDGGESLGGVSHVTRSGTRATAATTVAVTPAPTPVATPTPAPTPATNTTPIVNPVVTAGSPRIATSTITGLLLSAGQAFHVEATGTVIPGADVEDASFSWNFGDANSKYNVMPGFNAAHVYDKAGTYTVQLTVTSPNGKQSVSSMTVNVVAANVKTLYVAADGNDSANGSGPSTALRTLALAVALSSDDTTILMRRGDTFATNATVEIKHDNVTVATYGVGNSPTILWTGARDRSNVLWVNANTHNVTVRGLTFDSIYNGDTEQTGMPTGILAGGHATTIRDNTFLNIGYAINANQKPAGLIVQDNKAPSEVALRDYFAWVQGSDIVIVGNEAANSTREHNVRVGGADRLTIYANKLTNLDRTGVGDSKDNAKGTIACQKGTFAYIAGNQLRGPAGIGPLGAANGLGDKGARFSHAVFTDNVQYGGTFYLQHGAEHVGVRGNTMYQDGGIGFDIVAYNAEYGRGVVDVSIDGNVVVNNNTTGNFLVMEGAAQQISLTNNVYVAPYLAPGSFGTAAVFVNGYDLSSFSRIDSNTWPATGRAGAYAQGGIAFVDTSYTMSGHKDPTEWNSMPQVGNDAFNDVTLDGARTLINSLRLAA